MIKTIFFIGFFSVMLVGVVSKYLQVGIFSPNFEINDKSFDKAPLLIAHAGGLLQTGRTQLSDIKGDIKYHRSTNAKEAFELSYKQGIRYFEGDLVFTSDNKLVLRHGWGDYLYDLSGQEKPTDLVSNSSRTFEDITGRLMFDTKHVMTGKGIVDFLKKHQDVYFILDIKAVNEKGNLQYREVLEELRKLAGNSSSIMNRFIPQAYTLDDIKDINSFYDFPEVWMTLYRYDGSDDELLEYIRKGEINSIVCGHDAYEKHASLLEKFKELETPVYMHTINQLETFNYYIEKGISGVYTDGIRQTSDGFITIGKTDELEDY